MRHNPAARCAAVLVVLLLGPSASVAQDDSGRPRVSEVLRAMSDFLAAQQSFTFHAEIDYDVLTDWGGTAQLAGAGTFAVERPNRLHADIRDDVASRRFWYDGKTVTLLDPDTGFYATQPGAGDIDTTVDALEKRLGLVLPLGELVSNDPYRELSRGVEAAYYLGLHDADGAVCHHVALVQQDLDWQLWIELGKRPVPRKLVVTYKKVPGAPQFVAALMDWEFGKAAAKSFEAKLPKGATKIDFLEIREDEL